MKVCLLYTSHLDIDPNTLVKDLGVGTQQMVEIAKAVSKHSKVLVLDEPTSSLTDSEIREMCIRDRRRETWQTHLWNVLRKRWPA